MPLPFAAALLEWVFLPEIPGLTWVCFGVRIISITYNIRGSRLYGSSRLGISWAWLYFKGPYFQLYRAHFEGQGVKVHGVPRDRAPRIVSLSPEAVPFRDSQSSCCFVIRVAAGWEDIVCRSGVLSVGCRHKHVEGFYHSTSARTHAGEGICGGKGPASRVGRAAWSMQRQGAILAGSQRKYSGLYQILLSTIVHDVRVRTSVHAWRVLKSDVMSDFRMRSLALSTLAWHEGSPGCYMACRG